MKIKAVMFDYGNVLGKDGDLKLFEYLAKETGRSKQEVPKILAEELKDLFIGRISKDLFWKNVLNRFDYRKNLDYSDIFNKIYSPFLVPNKGILEIALKIKKNGIRTGVLSNMILPLSNICRSKGYFSEFDPVIVSAEAGVMKPEREIYLKMINLLDANPKEIIYIDDENKYLIPAKEIGIQTVLFNINLSKSPKKELEKKLKETGVEFN